MKLPIDIQTFNQLIKEAKYKILQKNICEFDWEII